MRGPRRHLKKSILLLLSIGCLRPWPGTGDQGRAPRIAFDLSSLRPLYMQPESVLADVEGFWRDDKAYWLTACWHKDVGYPVPPPGWIDAIKTLAKRPAGEREAHPMMRQLRSLESNKDLFLDTALPLLASLLPQAGCDLSTTVLFTTAIVPNAFQKNFRIVLNVGAADPSNRENAIFNTIVHELFHVGYYRCECLMSETPLNGAEEYDLVYGPAGHILQNTGQLLLRRQKYELAQDVYEVYKCFFAKQVNPYEGLGDLDNAIKNYEEVLRLSPGHVRTLEILAELKNKPKPK